MTDSESPSSSRSSVLAAHEGESIGCSTFSAYPAYRGLMGDFFPPPNLLLLDGPEHEVSRRQWDKRMSFFNDASSDFIRIIVNDAVSAWSHGSMIDIYRNMKDLAWKILLSVFLRANSTNTAYNDVVSLQEDLLRGQFSTFPLSVNSWFWRSARSKGIEAKKKLQGLMKEKIDAQDSGCPFIHGSNLNADRDELVSHLLLFTSSLAVKSLASLLTSFLLNLFLLPGQQSLASRIRELHNPTARNHLLRSILLETERLSPPVVGVMRRVQKDIVLVNRDNARTEQESPTLIPAGWDAWLYFVSAARDESFYKNANKFVPERFLSDRKPPAGFAFGSGHKTCLGAELTRHIVLTVATTLLDTGICLEGSIEADGVRSWLGWDQDVPAESIARDLKQLPCQRPRKAIKLCVV